MQKYNKDRKMIYTYSFVIIGVIVGCLWCLVCVSNCKKELFDYGLDEYNITTVMSLSQNKIVLFILKKRCLQMILFILVFLLTSYKIASSLFCVGFGFYYGVVICNLIIEFGIKGLGYGIACFFPHYIFYFLTLCIFGKICYKREKNVNNYYKNITMVDFFLICMIVILCIILALVWEIVFQKKYLNYFFQYLV